MEKHKFQSIRVANVFDRNCESLPDTGISTSVNDVLCLILDLNLKKSLQRYYMQILFSSFDYDKKQYANFLFSKSCNFPFNIKSSNDLDKKDPRNRSNTLLAVHGRRHLSPSLSRSQHSSSSGISANKTFDIEEEKRFDKVINWDTKVFFFQYPSPNLMHLK